MHKLPTFLEVTDGELHVHPHKGQEKVLDSKKQIIAMLCGKQSGKTEFSAYWMYEEILAWDERTRAGYGKEGAVAWAVSPSYPLQDEKMQPTFYDLFVTKLGIGKYHVQKKRLDVTISKDGAEDNVYQIKFKSADKVESLASATVFTMCLDEAGQDSFKQAAWEECRARVGTTAGRILITTTLYNFDWLKHLIYDPWKKGDPSIDVIQFKSIMNPSYSIAEWEYHKRVMPDWKFKMAYCGEFTRPLGRIYQDFDESCIVEPFDIPTSSYKIVGIDPGIVHHSTVWICEIHPNEPVYTIFPCTDNINPIYVIYDSSLMGSTTTTLTNKEHAEAMMQHRDYSMLKTACGGSASEVYFREDYRVAGIDVIEPPFKEVSAGIDSVTSLIKTHRLFIFSNQKRLIKEFEEYSYKLDSEGDVTPIIQNKELYHGLDSVRYACLCLENVNNRITSSFLTMSGKSMLDI